LSKGLTVAIRGSGKFEVSPPKPRKGGWRGGHQGVCWFQGKPAPISREGKNKKKGVPKRGPL